MLVVSAERWDRKEVAEFCALLGAESVGESRYFIRNFSGSVWFTVLYDEKIVSDFSEDEVEYLRVELSGRPCSGVVVEVPTDPGSTSLGYCVAARFLSKWRGVLDENGESILRM